METSLSRVSELLILLGDQGDFDLGEVYESMVRVVDEGEGGFLSPVQVAFAREFVKMFDVEYQGLSDSDTDCPVPAPVEAVEPDPDLSRPGLLRKYRGGPFQIKVWEAPEGDEGEQVERAVVGYVSDLFSDPDDGAQTDV